MDEHAPGSAVLLFKSPFQWAVYTACRGSLYELDPGIGEVFSRTAVSYAARHRFLWLIPLSRQHCLVNFDFPFIMDGPLFRQQKIPHTGRYIHQLDVRAAETLAQALAGEYLELALLAGRGATHGKA